MSLPTPDLSVHPLIAELNPQSDDQRRFVTIFGYIGPSSTSGVITLYPSLDLRCYLEISVDDILFAEPAIPGQVSSPSKLILCATAQVTRVESTRDRTAVSLLSGKITEANLVTSAAGDAGGGVSTEVASRILVHDLGTTPAGPHPTSHCVHAGACTSDPISF
jgi:hypothetical protein